MKLKLNILQITIRNIFFQEKKIFIRVLLYVWKSLLEVVDM